MNSDHYIHALEAEIAPALWTSWVQFFQAVFSSLSQVQENHEVACRTLYCSAGLARQYAWLESHRKWKTSTSHQYPAWKKPWVACGLLWTKIISRNLLTICLQDSRRSLKSMVMWGKYWLWINCNTKYVLLPSKAKYLCLCCHLSRFFADTVHLLSISLIQKQLLLICLSAVSSLVTLDVMFLVCN